MTEDFLRLKKDVKDCQNDESYDDCKTKEYIDALWKACQCLPFNIRKSINTKRDKKVSNGRWNLLCQMT